MYLTPEDAFWLLVATLEDERYVFGHHMEGLKRLKADARVFETLLGRESKRLSKFLVIDYYNMYFFCQVLNLPLSAG